MKKLALILSVFGFITLSAFAGDEVKWLTNYQEALAKAKQENKPLLIDFSGSDWCGWCIKLDKEVFSTEEFQKFANDNLVLFLADFPRKKQIGEAEKKQNEKLAEKYSVQGFPTVIIVDANENIILKTGYRPGGAKEYIKHLEEALKK